MTSGITFVSTIPGIDLIDELMPKKSSNFIPQWWKDTPFIPGYQTSKEIFPGNIKNCPSFPQYFSEGYILPMWVDTALGYDKDTNNWSWQSSRADFSWSPNSDDLLNVLPFELCGSKAVFAFKTFSPWKIITEPGYSCLILPLFFHFNNDFSVVPGIIDTDITHTLSPDVMYHSEKTTLLIEKGTPFLQIIPFKRESFNVSVKNIDTLKKRLKKQLWFSEASLTSSFKGTRSFFTLKNKLTKKKGI